MSTDTASHVRFSSRQRLILFALLGAAFMLSVDFSILNVALPEVGAGVGLGLTRLPWITSAFALAAAGFTLLFGRLADPSAAAGVPIRCGPARPAGWLRVAPPSLAGPPRVGSV